MKEFFNIKKELIVLLGKNVDLSNVDLPNERITYGGSPTTSVRLLCQFA